MQLPAHVPVVDVDRNQEESIALALAPELVGLSLSDTHGPWLVFATALVGLLSRYSHQSEVTIGVWGEVPKTGHRLIAIPKDGRFSSLRAACLASEEGSAEAEVSIEVVRGHTNMPSSDSTLRLIVWVVDGGLEAEIRFKPSRRTDEEVQRFRDHLTTLLRALVLEDEDGSFVKPPILTPPETRTFAVEWHSGSLGREFVAYSHRFQSMAVKSPNAIAVQFGNASLTYQALDDASSRVAVMLQSRGVQPGDKVCVALTPDTHILIAILASFKAGAIYVPIDPTHPPARIQTILADTRPALVLSTKEVVDALGLISTSHWCFDTELDTLPDPVGFVPVDVSPDDIAYVFYTSGTTGKPKGVLATHGNLDHYLAVARERYGFGPHDTFCSIARYTFSISMFELLSGPACGGRLIVLSRDHVLDVARLAQTLREVTVLHAGPSLLKVLLRYIESNVDLVDQFHHMRHASSGGDLVPPEVLEGLKRVFPQAEIFVIYGCTEISCMGTTFFVPRDRELKKTLVGRPFPDVRVKVVDRGGHQVPIGAVGEIVFGGFGVTEGYLDQPEKTQERYVFDDEERFYRTGDMGRFHASGDLEILGREDFQIQLHGIRIELGEVESTLKRAPGVRDAIVADRPNMQGEPILVGYIVPQAGSIDLSEIRRFVAATLPNYMIPSAFVVLEQLPLNLNLKVDRRALPKPSREDLASSTEYVEPRSDLERELAETLSALLGVGIIGVNDDLILLGASSLTVLTLGARLQDRHGVSLSSRAMFENPTIRGWVAQIEAYRADAVAPIEIRPSRTGGSLSFAQTRIWYADEVNGEGLAYAVPVVLDIRADVDVIRLQRALNEIVRRHDVLRMAVDLVDGSPVPRFVDSVEVELEDTTVAGDGLEAAIQERLAIPFSLDEAPLFRASIIRTGVDQATLFLNVHHLAFDQRSTTLLINELEVLYQHIEEGEERIKDVLPPLKARFADIADAERQAWASGRWSQDLDYWHHTLTPLPSELDLALDHPRPARRRCSGASVTHRLEGASYQGFRSLCRQQNCSPFAAWMALWTALLNRHTQQTDIVVGTAMASRTVAEAEDVIGCFINLLPLRHRIDRSTSFASFLRDVSNTCLDGLDHGSVPFEEIVRAVSPPRDPSRTPLFDTMVIFEDVTHQKPSATLGLQARSQPLYAALTDLTLWVRMDASEVELMISYDTALFEHSSVEQLLGQLRAALDGVWAAPECTVANIPWIDDSSATQMRAWNATDERQPDSFVVERLMARAKAYAEQSAVHDVDGWVTTGELAALVKGTMHQLRAHDVQVGDLVGVCLPRNRSLLVTVLAILGCGAGYVPLDPAYPEARLAHMVEDSEIRWVVADESTADKVPGNVEILRFESQPRGDAEVIPLQAIPADQTAYMIYTSGSTGLPKGVRVPYRAVANFLSTMANKPGLMVDDVLVAVTTLSFDISVLELFLPLTVGAKVAIASQAQASDALSLARLLEDVGGTMLQATPATWRMLLDIGCAFPARFKGLCGGEALPRDLAADLLAAEVELWNVYGPTETTVWSSCEHIVEPNHITIGTPIANTSFYVLDEQGGRQPIGAPGELYIGGVGVTLGYHQRDELTSTRFLADPYQEVPGETMYRTGDRVRLRADGRYEHYGRLDQQIKLRGHRIELGEIESFIRELELAEDCGLWVLDRGERDKRLVAFVTEPVTTDIEVFRQRLHERLPLYMLPQHVVRLDALPRTPNGKLDRKALGNIELRIEGASSTISDLSSASAIERAVAKIFGRALECEVGLDDDFFATGGHSLLAVKVIRELQDKFGLDIPLGFLFESPTVRLVAQQLQTSTSFAPRPISLNREGHPALFLLAGVDLYRNLAERLAETYSVYGVYVARELQMVEAGTEKGPSVEELAADYIKTIRAKQPYGPYRLGGVSFGGILAFEVARQLAGEGESVEHLFLLDAVLPETGLKKYTSKARRLVRLPLPIAAGVVASKLESALRKQRSREPQFESRVAGDGRVRELDGLRRGAYKDAAIRYMQSITPCWASATLIIAMQRLKRDPLLDPNCGWRDYLPNLKIHGVDADHLSMITGPAVAETAEVFSALGLGRT